MKKSVYIHYTVFSELNTFYLSNALKLALYPLIIALFGLIETNRQKLHTAGINQGTDNSGYTENKLILKLDLVSWILFHADPASVSLAKENLALSKQLTFKEAILKRMRPEKLLQIADFVIKSCTDNLLALVDTGITAATILKLSTSRDLFSPSANVPNLLIKAKTLVTKDINVTDRATVAIIKNQLNRAMKVIKKVDLVLYNDYVKITEITNEGAHSHHNKVVKAPLTLFVVYDETDEPVVGAAIKIVNIRGTSNTDANGNVVINLPLGDIRGKIVAVDCVNQNFACTLTIDGLTLTIRMKALGV